MQKAYNTNRLHSFIQKLWKVKVQTDLCFKTGQTGTLRLTQKLLNHIPAIFLVFGNFEFSCHSLKSMKIFHIAGP